MTQREMPVSPQQLPHHVAIIMDGNGRWAKQHGMPRAFGHRQGVLALRPIIEACGQWGIQALSLFAFSTENWSRPMEEIQGLMSLIGEFFDKEIDHLNAEGVRIVMLGDATALPAPQRTVVQRAMDMTRYNTGLRLNIALNYGSQQEITRAARRIAEMVEQGDLKAQDVDETLFERMLYTGDCPAVDLLVRTSGEMRISNFLLYQIAYAELMFVKESWPEFTCEAFADVLRDYARRQRRFGGIGQ